MQCASLPCALPIIFYDFNTFLTFLAHFLFFNVWKCQSLSRVWLFVTPGIVACQAPPSAEFSRQAYWSGLPFPSPGDLPDPEIEPGVYCIAGRFFTIWSTKEAWLLFFKTKQIVTPCKISNISK